MTILPPGRFNRAERSVRATIEPDVVFCSTAVGRQRGAQRRCSGSPIVGQALPELRCACSGGRKSQTRSSTFDVDRVSGYTVVEQSLVLNWTTGMRFSVAFVVLATLTSVGRAEVDTGRGAEQRYNVLFIISDDLTATALSCYGNTVCKTPNIDAIAARGVRFTRAYCQGTYCGPSRASFLTGYYPHATGELGYKNPRPRIGDRATWPQHFKNNGYYSARVSKIYHMGVPGGIQDFPDGRNHNNGNGADDEFSWTERFNSPGPEWKAPGDGETLERNPDSKKPVVGGNTFVVVEADGDDLVHSDGKTAAKAVELIEKHKNKPFWLGVGFVRPHVPW